VTRETERLIKAGRAAGECFLKLETAARQAAMRAAGLVLAAMLNADESDRCGPTLPCRCGGLARYVARREKTFVTVLGLLTLLRAYYFCDACEEGFCPRDRDLGLEGDSLSPAVIRMVGLVGATTSFAEGRDLLAELAGVSLTTKQVERTAEALGAEVAHDERERVEPEMRRPVPSTLYLGIDGTGVPMRSSEVEGRRGKQPDGKAKTREGKLCSIWSAESRDQNGVPTRDPGSATYTAAIESAATKDTDDELSAFAQRVWREAERRRFTSAERQAVLGDGAAYNWKIADELFPKAIKILDRFHAKERLFKVGRALFGPDPKQYHFWVSARCEELDAGDIPTLLERLNVHIEKHPEVADAIHYFDNNRDKMRYAEFHAAGLSTSSGVLEAGCKTVIGARLKRAGMHWTVNGGNSIMALRSAYLSGRLESFYDRRSAPHRTAA